jgi:hypothetical protein
VTAKVVFYKGESCHPHATGIIIALQHREEYTGDKICKKMKKVVLT